MSGALQPCFPSYKRTTFENSTCSRGFLYLKLVGSIGQKPQVSKIKGVSVTDEPKLEHNRAF